MARSNLSNQEQNQIDAIAEEFAASQRRGERPSIADYVKQYPHLGDDLRELLPVVEMLDQARQQARQVESNPSTEPPIGPGTRLGEYQLIRRIGRGGMGVVYQAEHLLLGSSVAIKLLRRSGDQPKLRERFQREASAAARIHHRHIVRVFDFGTCGESLYYVMSLVEGWGLNQIIASSHPPEDSVESASSISEDEPTDREQPPTRLDLAHSSSDQRVNDDTQRTDADSCDTGSSSLDRSGASSSERSGSDSLWTWAARIGVQAADGLDYAHSMGIVHRDIKPANLLLDINSNVFITDFGLAKIENSADLTDTGDILGTLRYLPPEAFIGRADHRSDIYGLGLTLYETVTGQPAIGGRRRGQLVSAITEGRMERLERKVPRIPTDLASIIHKSIDLDPTRRYQSAGEFRDDLIRFLSGQPVQARRATWAYNVARWIGRHRTVSALTGLLLLCLVLSSVVFAVSARRFQKLAAERQIQRNHALQKTEEASLNLLRANLSDARGWTTSSSPGQRIHGMKSLSAAIELSRELNVFDQYQSEINTIAATLATLNDVPLETSWRHPVSVDHYAPIQFSGDLSIYVHNDYRQANQACKIYRVASGSPEPIETIEIPGTMDDGTLRVSDDGTVLAGWISAAGGQRSLWICDRNTGQTYVPCQRSTKFRLLTSLAVCGPENKIAYISDDQELAIFDVSSATVESQFPLPTATPSTGIAVSPDGRQAAIFDRYAKTMFLMGLRDGAHRKIAYDGGEISQVAWRPDQRQLAIASDEILIWDIERDQPCARMKHSDSFITQLDYSHDGRLLLASGWSGFTEVHDVLAERIVLRCEMFLTTMSTDGKRAAFHNENEFQIRPILTSNVVSEYKYGTPERSELANIHIESGLLWLAPQNRIMAIDLIHNRVLTSKEFKRKEVFVAVDPKGRDIFASTDTHLVRLPIASRPTNGKLIVGPMVVLFLTDFQTPADAYCINLDPTGQHLATYTAQFDLGKVLHRDDNWLEVDPTIDDSRSTDFVAHPNLPLVVSQSHHHPQITVTNTDTLKAEFRLPYRKARARFSPNGEIMFVCAEGRFETYRVDTWEKLSQSTDDLCIENSAFAISSNGRWIAVQTYEPRGTIILNAETLQPALLLAGNHLDPECQIGAFDSSGRFLVANRGNGVIAAWDLYRLRQHFESLGIDWPLSGLGESVAMRDPAVTIEIDWNKSIGLSFRRSLQRFNQFLDQSGRVLLSPGKNTSTDSMPGK